MFVVVQQAAYGVPFLTQIYVLGTDSTQSSALKPKIFLGVGLHFFGVIYVKGNAEDPFTVTF